MPYIVDYSRDNGETVQIEEFGSDLTAASKRADVLSAEIGSAYVIRYSGEGDNYVQHGQAVHYDGKFSHFDGEFVEPAEAAS